PEWSGQCEQVNEGVIPLPARPEELPHAGPDPPFPALERGEPSQSHSPPVVSQNAIEDRNQDHPAGRTELIARTEEQLVAAGFSDVEAVEDETIPEAVGQVDEAVRRAGSPQLQLGLSRRGAGRARQRDRRGEGGPQATIAQVEAARRGPAAQVVGAHT